MIPGGESTTIGFMLGEHDMIEPLRKRIEDGMPVFGTCAGAILLADDVRGDYPNGPPNGPPNQSRWPTIGGLDIVINRNGYGRQVDSFESSVAVKGVGDVEAVFIRAPVILSTGDGVEVLAVARDDPVVVRQDAILAATFHPELTDDSSLHRYFLEEVC